MTSSLTSTPVSIAGTESETPGRTLIVSRTYLVSNLTMITPDATMTIEEYVDAYDPVRPVLRMTFISDISPNCGLHSCESRAPCVRIIG